jgi:hypothetical protein
MQINYLAAIAAALSGFLLGGLWYGPLLGKRWAQEVFGGPPPKAKMAPVFGGAIVMSLIAAFVFALFLGPSPPLMLGTGAGFACGAGWVATSLATNYLFARRSLALFAIDGGYVTLQFTLIGLILGLWH